MKNQLFKLILIFVLLYGCKNNQNIDGNYYVCENGEYYEVYFRKNLIRVAKDDEWVKLSKWRKMEYHNDTLKFDTFGEWKIPIKAVVKHIGINTIQMQIDNNKVISTINLKPIKDNLNFDNIKEFWSGFNNRKKERNCSNK